MRDWIFDVRSRPLVLLAAVFAAVTALAYYGALDFADAAVSDLARAAGARSAALDLFMESVTETGDVFYMLAFGVALLAARRTRRVGVTVMISLVIVTIATGYAKCALDRDRPGADYEGGGYLLGIGQDTYSLFCDGSYGSSYPSGHAARAAVFGLVLGYALHARFPRGAYLLLLYPALVSASRVYVLQHYPSDVLGGAALGLLVAGLVAKKSRLHEAVRGSEP